MTRKRNDVAWPIVFMILLLVSKPARPEDDAVLEFFKSSKAASQDSWAELNDVDRLAWLKHNYCALSSNERQLAAQRLKDWKGTERESMLNELLADNDVLVRYAAATAKFGAKVNEPEYAKRCNIEEVVQSSQSTIELAKTLNNGSLKENFSVTQQLIKSGRRSLPNISISKDVAPSAQLSLFFAIQEIDAAEINVLPKWADEIRKRLKREVSFDFNDVPFDDAIRRFSKSADVDIKFDELVLRGGLEKQRVSLRVNDMKADTALNWLVKLAELECVLRDKSIYITKKPNFACGPQFIILDVRDLEAAGIPAVTWKELLPRDVPGVSFDGEATCTASNGFLVFMTPMSGPGFGRVWTKPIVEYLNSIRKTLDLKPVEWKIDGK